MIFLFLFATGLFAGTVDAIAGGGGLITLPVLLGIGMPPHLAFGTNKLQSTVGTFMAAAKYHRHGLISIRVAAVGLLFGLLGAVTGAYVTQLLSGAILQKIVPFLLLGILLYTLFSPKLGDVDVKARLRENVFYALFGFILGFYDGFFGPGTGSLWVFALVFFLGYNIIKATAYTKLFNLNSSLLATICFIIGGNIHYPFALCMAAGQLLGGKLGAHLTIKKGGKLVRPLFLTVISVTIAVLLYRDSHDSQLFGYTLKHNVLPEILIGSVILINLFMMYIRRPRKSVLRQPSSE